MGKTYARQDQQTRCWSFEGEAEVCPFPSKERSHKKNPWVGEVGVTGIIFRGHIHYLKRRRHCELLFRWK